MYSLMYVHFFHPLIIVCTCMHMYAHVCTCMHMTLYLLASTNRNYMCPVLTYPYTVMYYPQ